MIGNIGDEREVPMRNTGEHAGASGGLDIRRAAKLRRALLRAATSREDHCTLRLSPAVLCPRWDRECRGVSLPFSIVSTPHPNCHSPELLKLG